MEKESIGTNYVPLQVILIDRLVKDLVKFPRSLG